MLGPPRRGILQARARSMREFYSENAADPLLESADFVASLRSRHAHGRVTRAILYEILLSKNVAPQDTVTTILREPVVGNRNAHLTRTIFLQDHLQEK